MKSSVAAALAAAGLAQADVAAAEAIAEQLSSVNALVLKSAERQTLLLDCPGCPAPVIGKDGMVEGMAVQPNHLELVFHVDHKDGEPDSLMLNNIELYPALNPRRPFLVAAQFVDEHAEEKAGQSDDEQGDDDKGKHNKEEDKAPEKGSDDKNDDLRRRTVKAINRHDRVKPTTRSVDPVFPQRLGFGLSVQPAIASTDDDGLELIRMHLQIIEVGQAFIDGIPGVHIDLVKTIDTGRLMIAKVEATQSQTAKPNTPLDGQPKDTEPSKNPADFDRCSSSLCRWMVGLRAKVQAMAEKAKKPLAKIKGHTCQHHKSVPAVPDVEAASLSPEEAATLPPHHTHHRHHRHHWKHMMKGVVSHIMLPILVGIVAGVTVSL